MEEKDWLRSKYEGLLEDVKERASLHRNKNNELLNKLQQDLQFQQLQILQECLESQAKRLSSTITTLRRNSAHFQTRVEKANAPIKEIPPPLTEPSPLPSSSSQDVSHLIQDFQPMISNGIADMTSCLFFIKKN